jgi:uncharacterized protein (DUF924 family)
MAEYKTPTDVLHFWFGEKALMGDIAHFRERCKTLWYAGTSADPLCVPFSSTLDAAASGALDAHPAWSGPESYPDAAIAKILLYDQLARNIHRGTKKAFSFDEQGARNLPNAVRGRCRRRPRRRFRRALYSVTPDSQRVNGGPRPGAGRERQTGAPRQRNRRRRPRSFHTAQRRHQRFGRYPHRNAALGRESTEEEKAWLASDDVPGWAKSQ